MTAPDRPERVFVRQWDKTHCADRPELTTDPKVFDRWKVSNDHDADLRTVNTLHTYIHQSELDAANAKIATLELCLRMAEQDAKDWKEQHRFVFVERDTLRKELEEARADLAEVQTSNQFQFNAAMEMADERDAALAEVKKLREAANKVIHMNRDHALHQYGNADKAETWSCITTLRAALNPEKSGE